MWGGPTAHEGSPIFEADEFWKSRPRYGYAGVAELQREAWIEPFWGGPRTYAYEWVLLEDDSRRSSRLDAKPPPRGGEGLRGSFGAWLAAQS